jgi:hypothetical protein
MTSSFVRALSVALLLASGCSGATTTDAAVTSDAGTDAATTPDAGHDAAVTSDAGRDASTIDGADDAAVVPGDTGTDAFVVRHDAGTSVTGDCATDADCPGGHCIPIVPGGFHVCAYPPVEATSCDPSHGVDQCCSTAECATGTCYLSPMSHCGGLIRLPQNECMTDECQTDADCGTDQACVPAGTIGPVKTCIDASCHTDADCTDEAGGHCVLSGNPCCHVFDTLVCTYPSDGCRASSDCAPGDHCELDSGRARCVGGGMICPG